MWKQVHFRLQKVVSEIVKLCYRDCYANHNNYLNNLKNHRTKIKHTCISRKFKI